MTLADEMPQTAAYVVERRAAWGAEHVKAMVAAGMQRGERNSFWAVEQVQPPNGNTPGVYKTVGAPFDKAPSDKHLIEAAMMYGLAFYGVMKPPPGS